MLTKKKRVPLFDPKQGKKEKGDIVIHPFQPSLIQTTGRAHPWMFFKGDGFWLDAGDKEKHGSRSVFFAM